jgi:hypothetical protein
LNPGLHALDGELNVVQIAFQQRRATIERMHVPVDEAGHQHAALKIYLPGTRADEWSRPGIVADVHDETAPNGQRLLDAVLRVHGVHEPVAINDVRRRRRGAFGGHRSGRGGGQRDDEKSRVKPHSELLPSRR